MDKLNLTDFEKYTITEDGKIFSKRHNRYLYSNPSKCDGYVRVFLWCKDQRSRVFMYHRVIWYFFNGDIPQGLEINHKDENKINNSLCNLELLSRGDNIRYGTRTERASISNSIVQKGRKFTKEHIRKLALAHSKPILQYNLQTNQPIKEWQSVNEAARELGYNSSTIGKVARGIYSQAYGYGWRYI